MKPLAAWTRDLCQRVNQLARWAEMTQPPELFWLSGFTSPNGFLAAVLQSHAQQHKVLQSIIFLNHSGKHLFSDEDYSLLLVLVCMLITPFPSSFHHTSCCTQGNLSNLSDRHALMSVIWTICSNVTFEQHLMWCETLLADFSGHAVLGVYSVHCRWQPALLPGKGESCDTHFYFNIDFHIHYFSETLSLSCPSVKFSCLLKYCWKHHQTKQHSTFSSHSSNL